jgi:FtsX-like permease family protein
VLAGRLPDPARAGEAVADFTVPGVRVGQRVRIALLPATAGDTHRPDLSARSIPVTITVVGIVAAPGQFPPFPTNSYFSGPNYYLPPAFYQAHRTSAAALEFSLVRVRAGAASAAHDQVEALGRGRPVAVQILADQAGDVNRSVHLVAVALWLLAGLLTAVAVLILGQLLARQISLDAADYPVLHSLGMTRRQLAGIAVLRRTAIGAAGGLLAVVVAVAVSPLAPIGLARTAEPPRGWLTTGRRSPSLPGELPCWPPCWRRGRPGGRPGRLRGHRTKQARTGRADAQCWPAPARGRGCPRP